MKNTYRKICRIVIAGILYTFCCHSALGEEIPEVTVPVGARNVSIDLNGITYLFHSCHVDDYNMADPDDPPINFGAVYSFNNIIDATLLTGARLSCEKKDDWKLFFGGYYPIIRISSNCPEAGILGLRSNNQEFDLYGLNAPQIRCLYFPQNLQTPNGMYKTARVMEELYLGNFTDMYEIDLSSIAECPNLKRIVLPDGEYKFVVSNHSSKTLAPHLNFAPSFGEIVFVNPVTDGVIYDADNPSLLIYCEKPEIGESYSIREGTEEIAPYTFAGITELKNIIFPVSLKEIGQGCFEGSGLAYIEWNDSNVAIISEDTFKDCPLDMNQVFTMPASVQNIERHAFNNCGFDAISLPIGCALQEAAIYNCDNLHSVYIDSSCKLAMECFKDCRNVNNVYLYGDITSFSCGSEMFSSSSQLGALHVPQQYYDHYIQYEAMWSRFSEIVPFDTSEIPYPINH